MTLPDSRFLLKSGAEKRKLNIHLINNLLGCDSRAVTGIRIKYKLECGCQKCIFTLESDPVWRQEARDSSPSQAGEAA